MISPDIAAKIAKGAARLDERFPGWEREIDLNKLDMASGNPLQDGDDVKACILCQVTKVSYGSASILAGFPPLFMKDEGEGFIVYLGPGYPNDAAISKIYDALNEGWTELIKERFSSGTLSG